MKTRLPQCKGKGSQCMKGYALDYFRFGKGLERYAKRKHKCYSFSHNYLAENKYIRSRYGNAHGSDVTLFQHVARCRSRCLTYTVSMAWEGDRICSHVVKMRSRAYSNSRQDQTTRSYPGPR
ncbi:Uncharacterized protein HZ326_11931 [Fusarium oxysporum f. sp. albedinis]|nr:Uncharacterized protein HZ326_11931 [Fusarium oxysporum f. sp. albedinis]